MDPSILQRPAKRFEISTVSVLKKIPTQHCESTSSGVSANAAPHRLAGHNAGITAVCLLHDGHVASASNDCSIRLWDLASGVGSTCLKGHGGPVNALCQLANGQLASGSDDKTIRLWDRGSGRQVALLQGHAGAVWALYALPGGCLASISTDNTFRVWDLNSGTETFCLQHGRWITAHCMLDDGRIAIASGALFSRNNAIRLWDPKIGAEGNPSQRGRALGPRHVPSSGRSRIGLRRRRDTGVELGKRSRDLPPGGPHCWDYSALPAS